MQIIKILIGFDEQEKLGAAMEMDSVSRLLNFMKIAMALLLSLLTPGLGQVFAGLPLRGVAIYICGVILFCLFMIAVYTSFFVLCLWILLVLIYYFFNCADSVYQSAKGNQEPRRSNMRWFIYPGAVILHLAFFTAFVLWLGFPINPYHIPSESMEPALQIGDYFLIDRYAYKKRSPERGDVVVFSSPTNISVDYVKRIVGLPGDVVEIYREKVWINGVRPEEPYLETNLSGRGYFGRNHHGPLVVPENSVYVLGDNRNHSHDSRQYKSISIADIKGKALFIVWARDGMRIGNSLNHPVASRGAGYE